MSERARLLRLELAQLEDECEVDRYRASGPGGQKRNKTESAIRVRHVATGISAHADDSRSQHGNRQRALERLRVKLALELRQPVSTERYAAPPALARLLAGPYPGSRPARASAQHLEAVAELLDLLAACDGVVAAVAAAFGVGTAVVSRLFTAEDRVLRAANAVRAAHGLNALRTPD